MRILISAIIIFAAWPALSLTKLEEVNCPGSGQYFSHVLMQTQNAIVTKELRCGILAQYHKVVTEIRKWTPAIEPFKIEIRDIDVDDFEEYDTGNYGHLVLRISWMYGNFNIDRNILSSNQKKILSGKFQTLSNGIFAHEYGHRIFDQFVVKDFPEVGSFFEIRDAYLLTEDQLKEMGPVSDLTKEKLALYEEVNSKNFTLNSTLSSLSSNIPENAVIRAVSHGLYNEFFADVVSLLHSENPSINYQSLSSYDENGKLLARDLNLTHAQRDFSVQHSASEWDQESPHNQTGAARSFLYKKLLKLPGWKNRKEKIVKSVYLAIRNELKKIRAGTLQLNSDNEIINSSFIKSLDEYVK